MTDEGDVIQAQQKLQQEQNLLTTDTQRLRASPDSTNLQRTVTAREFNVTQLEGELQEELRDFESDQGFSFFEIGARRQAELQAQEDARRAQELEAQRQRQAEAQRVAEEERLFNLQADLDRQAEIDRQAELDRLNADGTPDLIGSGNDPAIDPNLGGLPPAETPDPPALDIPFEDQGGIDPIDFGGGGDPITDQGQLPALDPNMGLPDPQILDVQPTPDPINDPIAVPPPEQDPFSDFFPKRVSQDSVFGSFLSLGGGKKSARKRAPVSQAKLPNELGGFDLKFGKFDDLFNFESLTGIGRRQTERKSRRKKSTAPRTLTADDIFKF